MLISEHQSQDVELARPLQDEYEDDFARSEDSPLRVFEGSRGYGAYKRAVTMSCQELAREDIGMVSMLSKQAVFLRVPLQELKSLGFKCRTGQRLQIKMKEGHLSQTLG